MEFSLEITKISKFAAACMLMIIGWLLVVMSIIIGISYNKTYESLQNYKSGQCTITAKQLREEIIESIDQQASVPGIKTRNTKLTNQYAIKLDFIVQTDNNQKYPVTGYDMDRGFSENRSSQQAIIDQYTVGKTYPCWYDPADPKKAVLTRQSSNGGEVVGVGICLLLGIVFFIIGFCLELWRRKSGQGPKHGSNELDISWQIEYSDSQPF